MKESKRLRLQWVAHDIQESLFRLQVGHRMKVHKREFSPTAIFPQKDTWSEFQGSGRKPFLTNSITSTLSHNCKDSSRVVMTCNANSTNTHSWKVRSHVRLKNSCKKSYHTWKAKWTNWLMTTTITSKNWKIGWNKSHRQWPRRGNKIWSYYKKWRDFRRRT